MKFFKCCILLFCIFSFNVLRSEGEEETIDIASLIDNRTQQYPLKDFKKICVLSPVRTGSTLVFNILRFLFENQANKNKTGWGNPNLIVHKLHNLKNSKIPEDCLYIFTIRNPVDACFSAYRVNRREGGNQNKEKRVQDIVRTQMRAWHELQKLLSLKREVILLRYEKFDENIDHIFSVLESKLFISIDPQDKDLLRQALSKENVQANIDHLNSFNQVDKIHLFHGKHIDQNEIPEEEKNMVMKMIVKELKKHRRIINKWGYSLPNLS